MTDVPTVRLANAELEAELSPHGAELMALRHRGVDLLWHGDARFWDRRSPLLFPIIGRPKDDRIEVGGQPHAMPVHGFARDRRFEARQVTPDACRFTLASDAKSAELFPFDFSLEVDYALHGAAGLRVSATIRNPSPQRVLPVSFGFHPGFCWPLVAGRAKSDYVLRIAAPTADRIAVRRLAGAQVQQEPLSLPLVRGAWSPRDEDFSHGGVLLPDGAHAGSVWLAPRDGRGRAIRVETENLPQLALWMRPGGGFMCIEPWHGFPDSLATPHAWEHKAGQMLIAPGASASVAMVISVLEGVSPP